MRSHPVGRRLRTAMSGLFTVSLLLGCGGGGGDTDPDPQQPAPTSGLDQRPSNTTCLAAASETGGSIRLETAFGGQTFAQPLGLLQAPDDDSRWFIVEQAGRVRDFDPEKNAAAALFVDLSAQVESGGETGLLGLAFHPQYAANGRLYLSYTHRDTSGQLISRVSVFDTVVDGDDRRVVDASSERPLITLPQPFDNHNGGHIAFGPDGYLYIGFGDGGSGGDPQNNAQRLHTLLGKLLRIDVDQGNPYAIPTDNPFAGGGLCNQGSAVNTSAQCPEIYAYGLRNPWRWSFDRESGALWLGDVGQGEWEEVNLIHSGGNYGWSCREGAHPFNDARCPASGLIEPVAEYGHIDGNASITGGFVYRGTQNTPLRGHYLFGDFASGRIWTTQSGTLVPRQLLDSDVNIASFGESHGGELYVVDLGGAIYRVVFETTSTGSAVPSQLSATGCVDASNASQPASGLTPYAINAPRCSDGADQDRWLALPNGERITVNSDGRWLLPRGGVLMKHFRRDGRLIETQLLMHHTDDQWSGATYEWNDAQTDATRVLGGARRTLPGGGEWVFSSEAECLQCHTAAANFNLGLQTAQLNRTLTYPQTQRTANQIDTLNAVGVLTPLPPAGSTLPAMASPTDSAASLEARARAWLDTNCAHCHRPGGPTSSSMDLRFTTPLAATQTCNVAPNDDLGLSDMRLLAPGDPARSMILNRVERRDPQQMPPFGTLIPDQAGLAVVSQWIASLTAC